MRQPQQRDHRLGVGHLAVADPVGELLLAGGEDIEELALVEPALNPSGSAITLTGLSNQFNIYANAYVGGIIGYGVGIGSAYLLGMYLPFEPSLQWQVALLAISTAIITGVMFGLYPAVRAAQKDPIETLRY